MTADGAMRFLAVGAAVLAMLLAASLAALVWDAHRRGMQRVARAAYTAEALRQSQQRHPAGKRRSAPTDAELDRLWVEVDGMLR